MENEKKKCSLATCTTHNSAKKHSILIELFYHHSSVVTQLKRPILLLLLPSAPDIHHVFAIHETILRSATKNTQNFFQKVPSKRRLQWQAHIHHLSPGKSFSSQQAPGHKQPPQPQVLPQTYERPVQTRPPVRCAQVFASNKQAILRGKI